MRGFNLNTFAWVVFVCLASVLTMVAINTLTMKIDNWKIQNRDNYANWMLCSAVCVLIAQGCVQFISPFAEGSGIP